MFSESSTNHDFQRSLISSYISHSRSLIEEPTFPADAKLYYEQVIEKIKKGMSTNDTENITLDEAEIALRSLYDDIAQVVEINKQMDRSNKTNHTNVLQRVTRSFTGIWRR